MSLTTSTRAAARSSTAPGWGTLVVLLTGVFVVVLDFFIVNVAIPATQHDLHAGPSALQFIVAGFGIAQAALLITSGRLGDLYGRRRLFMVGLGLFTLTSAACGAAPTAGFLVAARVVQGAAAALMTPQVLGIINTTYSGERRVKAFNAYGLAMGFGAVFGQLIGGALIRADVAGLGWRSIFLINVPVGVAGVVLTPRLVPESRGEGRGERLDLVGTALVSLGLLAVVYPLVQGRQAGWPLWTWLCLAAAVPLLGSFVMYQRRLAAHGGSPLINLSLFKKRAFSAGIVFSLVFSMVMASFFFVLALYLQEGRGLSPLSSGLIFLPLGLGYFVATTQAGRLTARLGRQVLTLGTLVVATGYGVLGLTALAIGEHGSIEWLIPGLVVAGTGMGFVMAPSPTIVLASVEPKDAAAASGVLSTAQQAGGFAIGVALIGVVFFDALGTRPTPAQFPHAFALGMGLLVGIGALVAGIVQLLPRSRD